MKEDDMNWIFDEFDELNDFEKEMFK